MVQYICDAEKNFTNSHPEAESPTHCQDFWEKETVEERAQIMESNFLKVNIYFESLNYETIEQKEDYPVSRFLDLAIWSRVY